MIAASIRKSIKLLLSPASAWQKESFVFRCTTLQLASQSGRGPTGTYKVRTEVPAKSGNGDRTKSL